MPRTNKKTRIKGVPPKLQLQQKDAKTGSFSSPVRVASDNRTGNYSVNFNDTNTVVFGQKTLTDNVFGARVLVKDYLMGYWKFNSGSFVSQSANNWIVGYPPVPNGNGYPETQLGGPGRNFTDEELTIFVSGNTKAAVAPVTDDLPFPSSLKTGNGSPFGEIAGVLQFQHNVTTDSKLWSVAHVYSGSLFTALNDSSSEDGFAVSAWIKLTGSYPDTGATILCKAGVSRSNIDWALDIDNDGLMAFGMYTDLSNKIEISSSFKIPLNEWTLVRAGYIGAFDVADLFVQVGDNVKETEVNNGSTGTYGGQSFNNNPVLIGCYDPTTPNFPGYICEVAIWEMWAIEHQLQTQASSIDVGIPLTQIQDSLLAPVDGVVAGIGLGKNSKWLEDSEQYTNLILVSGSVRAGVGDTQVHFTPGQNLTPFRDSSHPAVDGKSTRNIFYATGSRVEDVGQGFSQPLWSKSKIEIDMSTSTPATIGYRSGSSAGGLDFAMMYYNPLSGTYMPVGSGKRYDQYEDASGDQWLNHLREKAIAFTPGMSVVAASTDVRYAAAIPTSVWGFPYASKYFVDPDDPNSGSILIQASDYISQPFLLEKLVVEFSCSHLAPDIVANNGAGLATHAINTFFILNQRKGGTVNTSLQHSGSDFPLTNANMLFSTAENHQSGTMDVVTFNQFMIVGDTLAHATGTFPDDIFLEAQLKKEIQPFFSEDLFPGQTKLRFTGSINLSGTIKSPSINRQEQIFSLSDIQFAQPLIYLPSGSANNGFIRIRTNGYTGGRNGISIEPNTRNLNRTFEAINVQTVINNAGGDSTVARAFTRTPYLLKPGDQLILGWHCAYLNEDFTILRQPFPFFTDPVYIGPELTIPAGPAKLTLYGSSIANGKETHDTLNQLLTSEAIHEIIGND